MKTYLIASACIALAACASAPMNRDALHQHAERNCRVKAAVSPAYHIDSTGIDTKSSAYAICMRSAGFPEG